MQKYIKIGSSLGVTIPNHLVKKRRIEVGDPADVVESVDGSALLINSPSPIRIDPETIAWTDAFIEEYRPALEALAKK